MTKETEYDVGYRKPPANRRFEPGRSGKPTERIVEVRPPAYATRSGRRIAECRG